MTKAEIDELGKIYDNEYENPKSFECRYDDLSTHQCYSLIRHLKPVNVLAIGTWYGGSTCMIMSALKKNEQPFHYMASELLPALQLETTKNCLQLCSHSPQMVGDITKNFDYFPGQIDFLFVDTDHDLKTTQFIVERIFPRLLPSALVAIHDWAVEDVNGKWIGKGANGVGGWEETNYLMGLHTEGKLPLEKLFWNYHNSGGEEASFWFYKPL